MTEVNNKTPIQRKDYLPPAFLIDDVQLKFELAPEVTRVSNSMQIRQNPHAAHTKDLLLNGEKIELQAVYLNGERLAEKQYQLTDTTLTIFNVPEQFELRIENTCNPKANTALDGLYLSNNIFCTQCEPHGFRKITYYLDRPDVMATFTTTIIAEANLYPVLLSNGNCLSEQILADGRRQVVWQDPFKKPCYLFALVAGKLDADEDYFITCSGRKIKLQIFVEPGNEGKTKHAMEMLKLSMRWDEKQYGREYDLDIFMIVAVADFNMGAMENKGLNIFNAKYILANAKTATDADYEGIATVVAHEYFHNWTGNRITCRDWFQLSLKEGLTVFRDQEFTADITSRPVSRIDDVRIMRTAQFAEDAGPLAHPVRPDSYLEMNNFYTVTVYNKGAELIRMLQTLEGEAGYRLGMDLYFERFDGMAVTCDDFVAAHADANQRDYSQFMRWYSQAGTPTLTFSDEYDAQQKKYLVTVTQQANSSHDGSAKEAFHIPIKLALFNAHSSEKVLEQVIELTESQQTFEFAEMAEKPIPSLMRGFSAPVRWSYPYTLEQRIFLLKNDDDYFNRFEIAQQLFYDFFNQENSILPANYLAALQAILLDQQMDLSIKSRLLSAPTYRELCEQQPIIQVEKTIQKRNAMIKQIAGSLANHAYTQYLTLNKNHKPYHFDAESVGERSLKASCLRLLLEANHPEALQLTKDLYHQASNMTDQYNALYLLIMHADKELREKALADFHQQFQNDALVLEKWLSLHAMVPRHDTLADVKALLQHKDFDFKNPNKVRSLIGAFANQNFEGFHLANGAGYEFLAEQVIALDKINPIIAARLVEPLTRFRQYEDAYSILIRSALQRIALEPNLSNDLHEIVGKSISE